MSTTFTFKDQIDLPEWRPLSPAITASAAAVCMTSDLRNDLSRDPYVWKWTTTTTFEKYNTYNDEWYTPLAFTAVGGTLVAGAATIFSPTGGGVFGTGTGLQTTGIQMATLPNAATVLANRFANNGSGSGYKIRVVDLGSGGTGKTNERKIVANTSGTTPSGVFDVPLDFTPVTGARYELLSGAVYLLGAGTTAAGYWKKYDIATDSISGNLSVTNLAATIGVDSCILALDEQYVPYSQIPGNGILIPTPSGYMYDLNSSFGAKTALEANLTTVNTIRAINCPPNLSANEYAHFMIRIVQDTSTPTAAGQRRTISSHTAGSTPVFTTTSNWTVTPSSSAKFVIENNNDIILWDDSALVTYSYAGGGFATDGSWSTAAASGVASTQYANPGSAMGAGSGAGALWSIVPDANRLARNSFIYRFRGAATVTLDKFDIAANTWTSTIVTGNPQSALLSTGTVYAQDPIGSFGKYLYIQPNGLQRFQRLDMLNLYMEPFTYFRPTQGAALLGEKLACVAYIDGASKIGMLYHLMHTATPFYQCVLTT